MSDRRDKDFPSPFNGLELGGGGAASSPETPRSDRDDGEPDEETPKPLSRKQIRAIKKEIAAAETSLSSYLEEVKAQDLNLVGIEEILKRLEKYCQAAERDLTPLEKGDELVVKWTERAKYLEDAAPGIRAQIAAGDLPKALEGVTPVVAYFAGLEPVVTESNPTEGGGPEVAAAPAEAAPQSAATTETAPAEEVAPPKTKEELLQLVKDQGGISLVERVNKDIEKHSLLGVQRAEELVKGLFRRFESPKFRKGFPSSKKRRAFVDNELRKLGVKKTFGNDFVNILDSMGVFSETAPATPAAAAETAPRAAAEERSSEVAIDFDKAETLSDVYRMLEEMGVKPFTTRSRAVGEAVAKVHLTSAKTMAENLRRGIPALTNELRQAALADRKAIFEAFFKTIPSQYNLRQAVKAFVRGYLRESGIALNEKAPQVGEGAELPQVTEPENQPETTPQRTAVRKAKMLNMHALGWTDAAIKKLGEDGVKAVLASQTRAPAVTPRPAATAAVPPAPTTPTPVAAPQPAAAVPTPRQAPADLSQLMQNAPDRVSAAGTVDAAQVASESTNITSALDNPEFRAFFAKSDKAEELLQNQDVAAIETCHRAFVIKDKLATDLYELANGAIKGDFLLDFENTASNLPKNQRAEFQRYVDKEALERPEELLNLAFQLETRQVLEKNIATAKAEMAQLGGKEFFDEAEREALEMKTHLERAHESTRRDRIAGYIPHDLHLGFLKMTYKVREWVGWKGQTEGSIQDDFRKKREALLNGRAEADLMAWEKLAFNKLVQAEAAKLAEMKRHNALGERMVEVSQQGLSRAKLAGDGINLGLGSLLTYSPFWGHHPEIVRELENVNGRLAEIQKRKQTIEQVEQNLASLTQSFEAIRTSAYKELPPTIALVKYAQAQVKNTLTSFTEDTAVEDLQRIYEYALLLDSGSGTFDKFAAFSEVGESPAMSVDRLHEAIVAQWGKRVFEVFKKTALNKSGAVAEMEKVITDLLKREAIGGVGAESGKVKIVKGLLTEAFKKIDPAVGDGKERRMALIGVMINCGLLKKGEKITT